MKITKKIIFFLAVLTWCVPSTFLYCRELTPEEFVENNLKKTRERLALLKENYSKKHGGVSGLQVLDIQSVFAALPKPHTLKFFLEKKGPGIEELIKYYFGNPIEVAADHITSNFLGIPRDHIINNLLKSPVEFDVLSLLGVSIDGVIHKVGDIKELPSYDIFGEGLVFSEPNLTESSNVHLIIQREMLRRDKKMGDNNDDFGRLIKIKTVTNNESISRWNIPVTYTIDEAGPFLITNSGNVIPMDIGSAKVKMNMGRLFYFTRKITANKWSLEVDSTAGMGGILPDAPNRTVLSIYGPADMNQYKIQWGGNNIKWQKDDASIVRKGNHWIVENAFTVSDKAKMGDSLKLEVTLRNKNNGIAHTIQKYVAYKPGIFSIGLELAAKGQAPTTEGIDLFFPNYHSDANRFRINLIFKDSKNKEMDKGFLRQILANAKLSFQSSSPAVIVLDEFGGQANNVVGESMVSAKLDLLGKTLFSPQIKVTANKLLLTKENASGGATYIIRVIGPADMKKYLAVFHHAKGSQRAIFIKGDDGSQSAGISTIDPLEKVEIQKDGMVVASMPVSNTTVLPAPSIRLLPIKLPGKVVDNITPVDLGSLTSMAECRMTLRKQFPEYYGTASDDMLNSICSDMREKEKEEIKEQRKTDKAQLEILKSLKKEGRQLVVFSDATEIAASVSGSFDPKRMYCRWRIEQGGSLKMEKTQTDITSVGRDGACYNKIMGFQGDFNTNALATVELVYAYIPPPLGQFTPGGQAEIEGMIMGIRLDNYTDRKGLMEWIGK